MPTDMGPDPGHSSVPNPSFGSTNHEFPKTYDPTATLATLSGQDLVHPSIFSPNIPGFEIIEEKGRGGMGIVFQAFQGGLGRTVALKMVLSGRLAKPEARMRFLTEAETVAKLNHPNIVQIFEFGEHNGLPYLALEFCGGGSLSKMLGHVALPPRVAAAFMIPLAQAVDHAHNRNIVHRDLKPGNILLVPRRKESNIHRLPSNDSHPLLENYTAKITDFGLAKRNDVDMTQSDEIVGTPSYMAPEQARRGENVTHAVDVYALGALLYECLTGKAPFKGETPFDTMMMVRMSDPVPMKNLVADVPADLETICLKCLEKDPLQRYARATDFAEDLDRFLNGKPILARRVSFAERAWKWVKRHPQLATLSSLLILMMVLLLLMVVWGVTLVSELRQLRSNSEKFFEKSQNDSYELKVSRERLESLKKSYDELNEMYKKKTAGQ